MKLPDQDEYKLKQRIVDILAGWDQLLLHDSSGYRWARTSPELHEFSLVYVSKSKSQGEHYVSVTPSGSPHFLIHTALRMSPDAGLSIVYGLKPSFEEEWLHPRIRRR